MSASDKISTPQMETKSIDFDLVADYYDVSVTVNADQAFWNIESRGIDGPVLELMSGTGRVSLPLIRAGTELTCLDYSAGLLAVLRRKLESEGLHATLVHADARRFDL